MKVVAVGLTAGGTMVVAGGALMATGEKVSVARGVGGGLLALGAVALLGVLLYWFGRCALVVRPDGTLEYIKRTTCQRSVVLPTHAEVAMARTSVTRRTVDSSGGVSGSTVHYLAVVPTSELDRIKPRQRPPRDLLTVSSFPQAKDGELRQVLEQFTKVQVVG